MTRRHDPDKWLLDQKMNDEMPYKPATDSLKPLAAKLRMLENSKDENWYMRQICGEAASFIKHQAAEIERLTAELASCKKIAPLAGHTERP